MCITKLKKNGKKNYNVQLVFSILKKDIYYSV